MTSDGSPESRDKTVTSPVKRVALLVEASALLASLDYRESLKNLAGLMVPTIADWWVVDLLEEADALRRVVSYGQPDQAHITEQLNGRYPPWPDAPSGPFRVSRTGRTEVTLRDLDPSELALSRDPAHLHGLRQLAFASSICVPIRFRGQTLGAMTFARTAEPFRPLHVAFARTLGHRIGQAIALGRMYEELQNANRRKDEFLAMLGHELRNPLGALSNAVTVLQSGRLTRETETSLQAIIGRQLQHLTKLVGDLLDVARLTSGKIVLRPEPTDLLTVVERCMSTLQSAGRGDHHEIRVDGHHVMVEGDPMRLEQVLENLIDNAVKYTPPQGKIDVSIEENGRDAVLRVRDTGVGVAPELLPRIFDLFIQGQQGPDRPHGGMGVGLAIVKRLVDLHGGTIHVTSPGPGAGTEVIVRLPLAVAPGVAPATPAPSSVRRRRILVVEDNADARETLRLLLELSGHQVELAEDGWTGLEVALRLRPDVALIDLGLPGLDGYEVARRMRGVPDGAAIRLIALTGYGQPQDRRRATEFGFDAYLVKPVDRETLNRVIQAA